MLIQNSISDLSVLGFIVLRQVLDFLCSEILIIKFTTMKQFLILALSLLAISCSEDDYDVTPSGVLTSENREVTSSFSKIEASNGFTLNISQGGSAPLLVQADNNVIQYIETYVTDGTLILKIKDGVHISGNRTKTVNITLSVDELNALTTTGGSRILFSSVLNQDILDISTSGGGSISGSVRCSEMSLNISGGGTADINGTCETLNCNLTGASGLHLFGLETEGINMDIRGGSTAELYADRSIHVITASGGSRIYYKGTAQVVTSSVTGGSTISKL